MSLKHLTSPSTKTSAIPPVAPTWCRRCGQPRTAKDFKMRHGFYNSMCKACEYRNRIAAQKAGYIKRISQKAYKLWKGIF